MAKMIAKTIAGREYVYSATSAHAVSEKSAEVICRALNDARWQLKDGEAWHVYERGWYEDNYTGAAYQKFVRRNGRLLEQRA